MYFSNKILSYELYVRRLIKDIDYLLSKLIELKEESVKLEAYYSDRIEYNEKYIITLKNVLRFHNVSQFPV